MRENEKIEAKKQELIKLTSEFCKNHIDDEYRQLSEKLILKMSRKRNVPFLTGRLNIWAAAVVYSLGQINFLFDKSFKPYVSTDDINNYFNTSKSTLGQKSKIIRDMFKMNYYDKDFSTNKIMRNNPFADLVEINGFILPKSLLKPEYRN